MAGSYFIHECSSVVNIFVNMAVLTDLLFVCRFVSKRGRDENRGFYVGGEKL